jgi:hypothetical protein
VNRALVGGVAAAVVMLGGAAWFAKDSAWADRLMRAAGLRTGDAGHAVPSLAQAGVHKCGTRTGILYLDHACPEGSRELDATGGTMTVVTLPRPSPVAAAVAPAASLAAALGRLATPASGPLVKGLDAAEADRLREQRLDAATR